MSSSLDCRSVYSLEMKLFQAIFLTFCIVSISYCTIKKVKLYIFQNIVRANYVQEKCEKEAEELKNTPLHNKFLKDCVSTGTWTVTEDEYFKKWEECKEKTGYTSHQECLSMNNIHNEDMMAHYDCFDEIIDPDHHKDNNVYRFTVIDLIHYNSTPGKLYERYSECAEKFKETLNNSVALSNCYSEKVEKDVHAEFMTRDWVVPTKDEVKSIWKECEKLVDAEVVQALKKGEASGKSVPFLKCVAEKANIIEDDCFYLERDLVINKMFSGKDNREAIKECYKKSITNNEINSPKYFKCIFHLYVID